MRHPSSNDAESKEFAIVCLDDIRYDNAKKNKGEITNGKI